MLQTSGSRESSSTSDSEDDTDGEAALAVNSESRHSLRPRELPHGAFAMALKSSRLNSAPNSWHSWWTLMGNPRYGQRMTLYSKHGMNLAVYPNGKVRGTYEEDNRYALLEISSAGQAGHVQIKGLETDLFITMNNRGRVYGEVRRDLEGSIWLEELIGSYNTYLSRRFAFKGWYLALKKSGKPKPGPLTNWGQKAIQFLPRRLN